MCDRRSMTADGIQWCHCGIFYDRHGTPIAPIVRKPPKRRPRVRRTED